MRGNRDIFSGKMYNRETIGWFGWFLCLMAYQPL